jgi:hypothetical protein
VRREHLIVEDGSVLGNFFKLSSPFSDKNGGVPIVYVYLFI